MVHLTRTLRILSVSVLILLLTISIAFAAPILKLNSHGHDVVLLQQRLQTLGYSIKKVDGNFDNEVYRAVIAFQRDNKLTINGVVDAKTWNALKTASAVKPAQEQPKKDEKPAASGTSAAQTNQPLTGSINNMKAPESQPFLEKSKVNSIIATAKKQIGVKYQFGGTTPKGFDCSGFVQYVFAQNGFTLPRLADDQYKLGRRTANTSQLVPGDLVFFDTDGTGVSHCGIYLGNGDFIHASSSKGIRIDKLNDSYWKPHYYGGKHIVK